MILYTSKDCVNCDAAKQVIRDKSLDVTIVEIDMETRAGRDVAMDNRIMGVPVLDADKRYTGLDVVEYLTKM